MADAKVDTERGDANLEVNLVTAQAQAVGDLDFEITVGNAANGSVTLPNIARNKTPGTSGSRGGDDFTPCLHGRCPEGSVRSCRGKMTLDVESIMGCCMR